MPAYPLEYQQVATAIRQNVPLIQGRLTLAFGAIPIDIDRDRRHAVRSLESVLVGWVADAAGLLLALLWTAGFLPVFLEPNAVVVLLAKPVPRWSLLAGKYIGVLVFVAFQACVFVSEPGSPWRSPPAYGIRPTSCVFPSCCYTSASSSASRPCWRF